MILLFVVYLLLKIADVLPQLLFFFNQLRFNRISLIQAVLQFQDPLLKPFSDIVDLSPAVRKFLRHLPSHLFYLFFSLWVCLCPCYQQLILEMVDPGLQLLNFLSVNLSLRLLLFPILGGQGLFDRLLFFIPNSLVFCNQLLDLLFEIFFFLLELFVFKGPQALIF